MNIWNTKDCLTAGITEHNGRITRDLDIVEIPMSINTRTFYLHGEGDEWHRSLDAAVNRANEIKIKKLQSLDKQIKKISAIEFGS